MLYRRLSFVRNPTYRRLVANNIFLTDNPGTYTMSNVIPAILLRNNTDRFVTVKIDVQAPGAGAGNASITAFNCYAMIGQPIQAGSPGANGAAGCFWTLTTAKNTAANGTIVLGSPGLCAQANQNPNWDSGSTNMLTPDGGWGGKGGRNNNQNNNVGNNGNLGGTLASNTVITYPSFSFTLPSGGAGGSSGGCGRLRNAGDNFPPTAGVAGSAPTSSTFGNSGNGGNGNGQCYSPRSGGTIISRGSFTPPAFGTITYPDPATPRLMPANTVAVFNANLYGQGGLFNSPSPNPKSMPTITSAQNGSNGAIRVTAVTYRL